LEPADEVVERIALVSVVEWHNACLVQHDESLMDAPYELLTQSRRQHVALILAEPCQEFVQWLVF
jgi:hypothetical protein